MSGTVKTGRGLDIYAELYVGNSQRYKQSLYVPDDGICCSICAQTFMMSS